RSSQKRYVSGYIGFNCELSVTFSSPKLAGDATIPLTNAKAFNRLIVRCLPKLTNGNSASPVSSVVSYSAEAVFAVAAAAGEVLKRGLSPNGGRFGTRNCVAPAEI